jgi:hypothetical protein
MNNKYSKMVKFETFTKKLGNEKPNKNLPIE